jgi:hypothetical protein
VGMGRGGGESEAFGGPQSEKLREGKEPRNRLPKTPARKPRIAGCLWAWRGVRTRVLGDREGK